MLPCPWKSSDRVKERWELQSGGLEDAPAASACWASACVNERMPLFLCCFIKLLANHVFTVKSSAVTASHPPEKASLRSIFAPVKMLPFPLIQCHNSRQKHSPHLFPLSHTDGQIRKRKIAYLWCPGSHGLIPVLIIEMAANVDDEHRHRVWFLRSGRSSFAERGEARRREGSGRQRRHTVGEGRQHRGVFTAWLKGTPSVVRNGERTWDAGRNVSHRLFSRNCYSYSYSYTIFTMEHRSGLKPPKLNLSTK